MKINQPLSHRNQEPESGVLYLVGTPIGNLDDFSFRALNILKNVSLIVCEDTRQTKKLMHKFEIKNNLLSFNKHNSFKKIPNLIDALKSGKSIAQVSDAGMPSICDPGEDLVKDARLHGVDIISIPGPCAPLTAIVSSGFPASKFIFEGFFPRKKNEREKLLQEISKTEKTTVLFESPLRLKKLIKELKEYCGGEREIYIFRELTKKYEEHIGNNLDEIMELLKEREIIGEITVVIKGREIKQNKIFDSLNLKKELHDLINAGLSLTAASKYLAKKNNLPKRQIYNLY